MTMIGSVLGGAAWWGYYPPMFWARCWCLLLGVRVKVVGREKIDKKKSYVFVANHQGAFDIFSIYGYLGHNFRWMMRKGLSNIPFVGTACRSCKHILVDTSSTEALQKTMGSAEKILQDGMSVVVFPEGRRTDDGHLGRFKNGAFRLACEFGLPVVPISIKGSYEVMPRSTFNVKPGTIVLTIHDPIEPQGKGHDVAEVARKSLEAIAGDLGEELSL